MSPRHGTARSQSPLGTPTRCGARGANCGAIGGQLAHAGGGRCEPKKIKGPVRPGSVVSQVESENSVVLVYGTTVRNRFLVRGRIRVNFVKRRPRELFAGSTQLPATCARAGASRGAQSSSGTPRNRNSCRRVTCIFGEEPAGPPSEPHRPPRATRNRRRRDTLRRLRWGLNQGAETGAAKRIHSHNRSRSQVKRSLRGSGTGVTRTSADLHELRART